MSNKGIRFFCFGLVFAIMFSLLNLSMRIKCPRWDNFYNIPTNTIDVLFIGNSHNFSSFQPQIINKILPIKSYVVGISAENIVVSYYELQEVLKYQHPKVVVLETFTLDLDDSRKNGYIFDFLDSGKWNKNRTAIAMRYLTPETGYSIFPALRSRMDWDKPYLYINQLIHELRKSSITEVNPDLSNASVKEEVIDDIDYRVTKSLSTRVYAKPNPDIQIYLEKFYQLCKDNNIQLVLTTVPIVNSTSNQTEYYKPFDASSFIEQNKIPKIDYDSSKFNHLHFANGTHINGFGSVIVSIEMAAKLSEIMYLPINRTELEYYQSFVFSDYRITHQGNDYTIYLIPSNQESPLEYKWIVQDKDINVVYDSGWQNNNSFTFHLYQDGTYRVFVEIKNPQDDYLMTAVFSISDSK